MHGLRTGECMSKLNLRFLDLLRSTRRLTLGLRRNNLFGKTAMEKKCVVNYSKYSKINFGCGYDKLDGYLNVDVDPACKPDVLLPIGDLSSLPKHHFREVYAKDVLEHIPRSKSLEALLEFSSLLRDDGMLFVQTTSITQVAKKLEENPSFADQYGWTICLFGNQVHPGDFHYTGFTDTSLTVHLAAAGFEVTSKSMVEDWCMRFECRKRDAWDDLLDSIIDNPQFIALAYERFFYRTVDDIGLVHFGRRLDAGVDRRTVLKEIVSPPERLFVTARRIGL